MIYSDRSFEWENCWDAVCPEGFEKTVFFEDKDFNAIAVLRKTPCLARISFTRMMSERNYEKHYARQLPLLRIAQEKARQLSLQCELAELPYGGGYISVSDMPFCNINLEKTAEVLNSLEGSVIAVGGGLEQEEVAALEKKTPYACFPDKAEQYTAASLFYTIDALAEAIDYGKKNFAVGIHGVGRVGALLSHMLVDAGADVYVSDKGGFREARARAYWPDRMHCFEGLRLTRVHVLAICASEGTLSQKGIKGLCSPSLRDKAVFPRAVCGCFPMPLAHSEWAEVLRQGGKLFVPPYLVNSGAAVAGAEAYEARKEGREFDKSKVMAHIRAIPQLIRNVAKLSLEKKVSMCSASEQYVAGLSNFYKHASWNAGRAPVA